MDREQLVLDNLNLVYAVIRKYYPTFIKDEDLIECGKLGLCQAANAWEEEKGTFSCFAWQCIRNAIRKEFYYRNKSPKTLSLTYEVDIKGGSPISLEETLIGDDDVAYIDVDGIYNQLRPLSQKILDLKRYGLTPNEIASKLGCSTNTVYKHIRVIKKLLNDKK